MSQLTSLLLLEKISPITLQTINAGLTFKLPNPSVGILFIEVQPAAMADALASELCKNTGVQLAHKAQDGRTGWLVVYSAQLEQLRSAAQSVEASLGEPQAAATILNTSTVHALNEEHVQLLNRQLRRVRYVAKESMLTIDCKPAITAVAIANQLENNTNCRVQFIKYLGSSGRLMVTGSASDINACSQQL